MNDSSQIKIGWAETDITPRKLPVLLRGQMHARLAHEVADPLKATVCAMEAGGETLVFVGCDLVNITDGLQQAVGSRLKAQAPDLDFSKVILNATHTHEAPLFETVNPLGARDQGIYGVELGNVPVADYVEFAADQMASAVAEAWKSRQPGGVAFGLEYAVVGRNRRWVKANGQAQMYGLASDAAKEMFRHIEGYEDHSLNVVGVYDDAGELTGLIVNVPSPSQEEENIFKVSADFWHETRAELRWRFGENLFVLPQCSSAGDLTTHLLYETGAHARMLKLRERSPRQEIACRIADAVGRVLPCLENQIERVPVLRHHVERLELPVNRLTQADVDEANRQAAVLEEEYRTELKRLEESPGLKEEPKWYQALTKAFGRKCWYERVGKRFEEQQAGKLRDGAEVHVVRLGEIGFATNPFEYYLDYGVQIKVRSPALQTFLVQLAGTGPVGYVPSPRSVGGGGYGSVPASNHFGPEAGQELADRTVALLRELWRE